MMAKERTDVLQRIRAVLAADLACDPSHLMRDGVTVHQAKRREGGFRFPVPARPFQVVTMGRGAVVSCHADDVEWMCANLGKLTCEQLFEPRTIAGLEQVVGASSRSLVGPVQKYVCTHADVRTVTIPRDVSITTVAHPQIAQLYPCHQSFPNALPHQPNPLRPDMVAAAAMHNGRIVGIACASADCDTMWQIGVDVLPDYRRMGIGAAIVGTVTRAVLEAGVIPYYSTMVANLPSRQLAKRLGYWPAWVHLYARQHK